MKHQTQLVFGTRSVRLAVVLLALGGLTVVFSADPGGGPPSRASAPPTYSTPHYEIVTPSEAKTIVHDGAELQFPAGAVSTATNIGMASLDAAALPELDYAMTNVTRGPRAGYRFTPHGSTFARKITVSLPYDPGLVLPGHAPEDIYTYFFDEAAGSWTALERVKVDTERQLVISHTDHFTNMVNGTVTVPDHATPASFNPTSIKDIKAADPGAGINLIEPPQPNNFGTTNLQYPIEIPPGRSGMQPHIAVQYDSGGRNNWMGVGWDLPMPAIMIDTRWGVPRYADADETETYLLNGEQLTPVAHRGALQARSAEKEFHTRVEGMFHKIIRHGDHPTNYWWVVTDKQGTRHFYGGDPSTSGPITDATLTDPVGGSAQNIYKWALREVRDTNGNTIKYTCVRAIDSGLSGGTVDGVQLYLDEIRYTGSGTEDGAYSVRFIREGGRPDVMIDCRPGFKMVTTDRLAQVHVKLNGELIRSYQFEYITGAFDKTLLGAIAQYGENGALFNRHQFEYFDEVRDAGGDYDGFAAAAAWNTGIDGITTSLLLGEGQASALGGFSEVRGGGHLYLGFNPSSRTKQFSAGGKAGFSLSEAEGLLMLADVNGDELPDKVFKGGDHFFYRPNLSGPDGGTTFGNPIEFRGTPLPAIFKETSDTTTFGAEAYPTPLTVMLDDSSTFTTNDVYFADVNGDGITDLVHGGSVLFGFLDADGVANFSPDSNDTPVPVESGAVDATDLLTDFGSIFETRVDQYPLLDAVRRWVAPFDGQIRITGDVQLEDTSAEQAAENYHTADGVRIAIQHNGSELWSMAIDADDHALHPPAGLDSVSVQKGDRIHFRVQSVFDGKFDRVTWTPQVEYTGVPAVTDANGLNPYRYDAAGDFTLAGRTSQVQVPFDGTVRVHGGLNKLGMTTDDVTLQVSKNGTPVISRSLAWDQAGAIPLDDDLGVLGPGTCEPLGFFLNVCDGGGRDGQLCSNDGECPGDVLDFYVRVDSPIDLSLIDWAPELFYTASPEVDALFDSNGDPLIHINPPYDIDLYPIDELTAPQQPWVVPASGDVFIIPQLSVNPAFGPFDSEVVLTVKRRDELVAKRVIPIVAGTLPPLADLVFTLSVTEDDELFFDYSSRDARDLTDPTTDPPTYDPALTDKLIDQDVAAAYVFFPIPFPVPSAFHNADLPDAFNEPYRGWAVVAYNGNRDRATQPIDESVFQDFLAQIARNEQYSFDSSLAYPQLPYPAQEHWRAPDDFCWIARERVSSSRLGVDFISVPGSTGFAGARAVPRIGTGDQTAVELGVTIFSGSTTLPGASSRGELDFMDMNADRFPDIVGRDHVQYTTMTGGLESQNRAVSGLHPLRTNANEAANAGAGFGVGGNPASSKQDPRGNVSPSGTRGTATGEQGSQMPELGFSAQVGLGSSQTQHDLIDLNGDGLSDRVAISGGQLRVAFNLGYGFAPQEPWSLGDINSGSNESFNLGANLGYNDLIYGFGGGASLVRSEAETHSTLLDVNGDDLLDYVVPDGTALLVAFNTGAGFSPPVSWRGALTDQVAQSITATEGGGAFFTIGIGPICLFGCYIIINPGAHLDHSMSRPEVALRDLDGDGYVDHVFSDGDDGIEVASNRTGRTNLLRTVRRPLGAVLTFDYQRDGNTSNLPQSRWNLSRVDAQDGFCGDGVDTLVTTHVYQGGKYSRSEREFYGYRTVVEQQRDASNADALFRTITRTFLNDTYYRNNLLESELLQDAAGNKFTEEVNTYRLVDIATGTDLVDLESTTATVFPQLVRTDRFFYEGQAIAGKSTYTTSAYDTLGNAIEFFDAGDIGAADDLTATIGYFSDAANHVVGIPDSIVVIGNGVELRRREATIQAGTGDLLQVRQYLANGDAAVTDLEYFANGNLQRVTGPPNLHGERYVVDIEYEAIVATHISHLQDSFGYASTATYNLPFGKDDVTTDINGNQTDYEYDPFGRVVAITGPYETGGGLPTLRFEYHPDEETLSCPGSPGPMPWALTRHIDSFRDLNDPIETVLFTDGLKRVLQTKKDGTIHTGPNAAPQDVLIVSGRVTFDHVGRKIEQFYPITELLGSPGIFNPAYDGVAPTRTEFDVLDRTRQITIPDNTVTTSTYGFGNDRDGVQQFQTIIVDANGIEKHIYRDVRELIASIQEFNNAGNEALWTSYTYDVMKQIVRVDDDHHNITNVTYDNFGRTTVIDNPDAGQTQSHYDLADNLTARVTANLQAAGLQISYDYQFNRLMGITYPLFAGNNVAYTYGDPGAVSNRAGRIATATSEAGSEERFYGKLGEVTKEIKTVASDTQGQGPNSPEVYTTQYTYDTWNRLQQMVYPDGEVLTYNYDSGGLVRAATGVKNGFTFPYIQKLEYDKFEQRAFQQTQNSVRTTYAYDPLDRRLNHLAAGKSGSPLFQNLFYTYDGVGNILQTHNDVPVPAANQFGGPVLHNYAYDDLHRLISASGSHQYAPNKTSVYSLGMTYDTIHNITYKAQFHDLIQPSGQAIPQQKTSYAWEYAHDGPQPHAPTHIGERTFSYDSNGNQLGWEHDQNGTDRTIVWDEENRIQSIFDNGHEKTYKYDEDGERVIKRGPQGETAYVNPYFTVRNRTIATKHVYAGITRVSSKITPGFTNPQPGGGAPEVNFLYYYHPDHLGSSSYVTAADGKLYEHLQYFPFGETWVQEKSNTQRTPYQFTAKELDEETDLHYFGARYYDSKTSVWQSVDPILDTYLPSADDENNSALPGIGGVFSSTNLALYSYVGLNPLRMFDYDGLSKEELEQIVGAINAVMNLAWTRSFNKDGTVKEMGSAIVRTPSTIAFKGERFIGIKQFTTGESGGIVLNTSTDKGETLLGTFHTHPYSKKEGGHTGIGLSGGDIANFAGGKQGHYKIIEAGTQRLAIEIVDMNKFKKFGKDNDIVKMFDKELAATKATDSLASRAKAAAKAIVQKKDSGLRFYQSTDKAKVKFEEVK